MPPMPAVTRLAARGGAELLQRLKEGHLSEKEMVTASAEIADIIQCGERREWGSSALLCSALVALLKNDYEKVYMEALRQLRKVAFEVPSTAMQFAEVCLHSQTPTCSLTPPHFPPRSDFCMQWPWHGNNPVGYRASGVDPDPGPAKQASRKKAD